MIFCLNETSLGSSVAMAEGYDCSIGTALALIDSARNDYAMFESMLNVDATELQLRQEGYVSESSEIIALQESTISNIWKKICEFFKKLAAKIKAIFHTFFSKINSLFMSDKKMISKYEKELLRKTNLGKMEIKVRDLKISANSLNGDLVDRVSSNDSIIKSLYSLASSLDDRWTNMDRDDKFKAVVEHCFPGAPDWMKDSDDFTNNYMDDIFDDESTEELQDTEYKNIRNVINILRDNLPKAIKKMQTIANKNVNALNKAANEANKQINEYVKQNRSKQPDPQTGKILDDNGNEVDVETKRGNRVYELCGVYQDVIVKTDNAAIESVKLHYKQAKAIFMKAIAANDKKLEESAIWSNAIFEATEDEVDDIFDSAANKDLIGMGDVNAASRNILDSDVSDDPDKLTYGPNKYTDDARFSVAGSVDSDITSRNESAYFGSMLY